MNPLNEVTMKTYRPDADGRFELKWAPGETGTKRLIWYSNPNCFAARIDRLMGKIKKVFVKERQ